MRALPTDHQTNYLTWCRDPTNWPKIERIFPQLPDGTAIQIVRHLRRSPLTEAQVRLFARHPSREVRACVIIGSLDSPALQALRRDSPYQDVGVRVGFILSLRGYE